MPGVFLPLGRLVLTWLIFTVPDMEFMALRMENISTDCESMFFFFFFFFFLPFALFVCNWNTKRKEKIHTLHPSFYDGQPLFNASQQVIF